MKRAMVAMSLRASSRFGGINSKRVPVVLLSAPIICPTAVKTTKPPF